MKSALLSVVATAATGLILAAVPFAQRSGAEFPRELVSFGPPSAAPVLAGTGSDTWDRRMRERGWVMRESDGWHLWYTGYNDARSDSDSSVSRYRPRPMNRRSKPP